MDLEGTLEVLFWQGLPKTNLAGSIWGRHGNSHRHRRHACEIILGEGPKKKLRKFGHMSLLGLPYLPSRLVWTKKNLDKYTFVYPTYLSKKFGHFLFEVCP